MKPKIVILSAFLTPFRSGAEACAEEVPLHLADRYDFTIITVRGKKSLPKHDLLQGKIPIVRVGLGLGLGFDKWLFPFLAPLAARKLKPGLIHAVLESFAGLAMVHCIFIVPRAKRMLTCQSTNTKLHLDKMHKAAHKITCISSPLIERAKKFKREDAILIPNGISLKEIADMNSWYSKVPGRILFVGRLRAMKGIDTLLEAIKILKKEEFNLHIVGDGPLRNKLERQAEFLGIKDRVRFLGYISSPDVYKEFAQAEIFCGLSRHEALGNVFLEAQAAGCAVVGTNIEGIPDIVTDGETGILVDPDDADAASMALAKLLVDEDLRRKLSEAGKGNAANYDWAQIATKYSAVYDSLLSRTN
ncbi:MAG: glycosyltransferase family 4 protein [Kiritimatiellales bacterium]|nr:glycosyltransferase family 4 protein [Kiritimatiellales bacterium]